MAVAASPQPVPTLAILSDVALSITVVVGEVQVLMKDVATWQRGTVVTLDRPAGAPVDVCANGKVIAKGEVVVVDEEFAVRITDIVAGA